MVHCVHVHNDYPMWLARPTFVAVWKPSNPYTAMFAGARAWRTSRALPDILANTPNKWPRVRSGTRCPPCAINGALVATGQLRTVAKSCPPDALITTAGKWPVAHIGASYPPDVLANKSGK